MRRMNNLVTLFTAMVAFFFGSFITTILMSVEKCQTPKSGMAQLQPHPELFLIVVVLSAPLNTERRHTMRETWLQLGQPLKLPYYPEEFVFLPSYDKRGHLQLESVSEQSNRLRIYLDWFDSVEEVDETKQRQMGVKHYFAVGTAGISADLRAELQHEHKKHDDLLLLPRIQDSYANLTEKMLHVMETLTSHYDFSYLLKVDDDSYVKLDSLLNELVSYDRKLTRKTADYRDQPLPQLYWGYFNGRASIMTKGQWRESNYYLARNYIVYALGGGYVLSYKLCEHIAKNARHFTPYISEDVSIGTWLAPLRHVYRHHDTRFDTGYIPRKCRRKHLVLHKRNLTVMRDLYAGKLCTFETANELYFRRPKEYFYDWSKPLDKCCDSTVT